MFQQAGAINEHDKIKQYVDGEEKRKSILIQQKMRASQNEVMFIVDKEEIKEVLKNGLQIAVEITGQVQRDAKSKPKQISLGYAVLKIID